MGILDKSKSYRISGAKLSATAPPRVVKVHLKSHIHLSDVNKEAILESPSGFEDRTKPHEENSVMSQCSNHSINVRATKDGSVKERKYSIKGEMSPRELTFRLAFPKAMRSMLKSSRCDGNRRSSLPFELGQGSVSQLSDICLSDKKDCESLSRRQSLRNALQSRRGSWCTNATIDSSETDNQRVWPGGRFHSFSDRSYLLLHQSKVEVIWNDSYSINSSTQEEKTPLTDISSPVTKGSSSNGSKLPYANFDHSKFSYANSDHSKFPYANSDHNCYSVATPSPLPCLNKPKVSKFMSKCCM